MNNGNVLIAVALVVVSAMAIKAVWRKPWPKETRLAFAAGVLTCMVFFVAYLLGYPVA